MNESGELIRLAEDELMMQACALSEAEAMATAAAALASTPVPAPAPLPAPARAPAPLSGTSAATAPAIGKAYSSDVTGDGPAPRDRGAADAIDDLLSAAAPARAAQHAPSLLHALSLPHHAPHRVLICWRDGCGRHSARQSGEPSVVEFYCCVPCAQLEGHSEPCDRAYSQHALSDGRLDALRLPHHVSHAYTPTRASPSRRFPS